MLVKIRDQLFNIFLSDKISDLACASISPQLHGACIVCVSVYVAYMCIIRGAV